MVFSHGIAGNQTMYSTLCCGLASRGTIVAAIEHSDLTASATLGPDGSTMLSYVHTNKDLLAGDDGFTWRLSQVEIRVTQFLRTVRNLFTSAEEDSRFAAWHGMLDATNVTAAGHSFGGCTVCAAVARCSAPGFETIIANIAPGFSGFRSALLFDAALLVDGEQIAALFGNGTASDPVSRRTPLLFIDAESFAHDPRWWQPKVDIAETCWAQAGTPCAVVCQRSSYHHTPSDAPMVTEGVAGLLASIRGQPPNLKRNDRPSESMQLSDSPVRPPLSAEALLDELVHITWGFMSHWVATPKSEQPDPSWTECLRNPDRFNVLTAAPEFALPLSGPQDVRHGQGTSPSAKL